MHMKLYEAAEEINAWDGTNIDASYVKSDFILDSTYNRVLCTPERIILTYETSGGDVTRNLVVPLSKDMDVEMLTKGNEAVFIFGLEDAFYIHAVRQGS